MNKKILIVDDEPDILSIYAETLTEAGFDVSTATNGEECLQKAELLMPDLVLLDVKMPVMDGVMTLSKMRENPKMKDLRVVFLTAFGDPKFIETDVDIAKQLGATDFIKKGIDLDALATRIKEILQ